MRRFESSRPSHTAVRICSHATADVQIALRNQCLCDRVHSQASAFVLLQPENLTVSMTVYFGRPVCRGTWRYRHGIDRHAHPQRQAKAASHTSSATAAACIFSSCRTARATGGWTIVSLESAARSPSASILIVSLSDARSRREEARALLAKDIDPGVAKKATKRAAKLPARTRLRPLRENGSPTSGTGWQPVTARCFSPGLRPTYSLTSDRALLQTLMRLNC